MTGGQFLAITRCSSTSSASSELLGEKIGLLATPSLKQNGSVTWAVFFGVQMLNVWKELCVNQLTVGSVDVFKLDKIAFCIGWSRSYLH